MKRTLTDQDTQPDKLIDIKSLREEVRKKALVIKPNGDYYIKTLRSGKECYFHRFAKELVDPKNQKYPKRKGLKKPLTVMGTSSGTGIFSRIPMNGFPLKVPQFTQSEKENYTNFQSTSLGSDNFIPNVFGFDKRAILVGVLVEGINVLLSNRLYEYDGGTIERPYDAITKSLAEAYQKTVNTKLYSKDNFPQFKAHVLKHIFGYSEALVRLSWVCDGTCKIFIATDNLPSRLLAKQYADALLIELKNAGKCPPDYQIPICFLTKQDGFIPAPTLNCWKEYTHEEYLLDVIEAHEIFNNEKLRHDNYKQEQYEFLLALKDPQLIHQALREEVEGMSLAAHLLRTGHMHIYQFLLEKINFKLEIEDLLSALSNRNDYQSILFQILENATRYRDFKLVTYVLQHINIKADDNNALIAYAIEENLFSVAKELIESKWFNLHAYNNLGLTALTCAAEKGQGDIIELLVKHGVKVEEVNQYGLTSFFHLCCYGRTEACKLLLDCCQPNINTTDKNGFTSLELAVENGYIDIISMLLKNKATIRDSKSLIMNSINKNNVEIVELLLNNIPNIKDLIDDGYSQCILSDDFKMFQLLFKYGVKIQSGDLRLAVHKNRVEMVHLLAKNNPHMEAANDQGNTAFLAAAIVCNLDILKILLVNNANPFAKTINGATALMLAIFALDDCDEKDVLDVVQFLLVNKADVNEKDQDGDTALMIALGGYSEVIIKLLLDNNANVDAQNNKGDTALIIAARQGKVSMLNLLLEKNPNIDIQNKKCETALSVASNDEIRALIGQKMNRLGFAKN